MNPIFTSYIFILWLFSYIKYTQQSYFNLNVHCSTLSTTLTDIRTHSNKTSITYLNIKFEQKNGENCDLHNSVDDFLKEIPAYTGVLMIYFPFLNDILKATDFSLFGPIFGNLTQLIEYGHQCQSYYPSNSQMIQFINAINSNTNIEKLYLLWGPVVGSISNQVFQCNQEQDFSNTNIKDLSISFFDVNVTQQCFGDNLKLNTNTIKSLKLVVGYRGEVKQHTFDKIKDKINNMPNLEYLELRESQYWSRDPAKQGSAIYPSYLSGYFQNPMPNMKTFKLSLEVNNMENTSLLDNMGLQNLINLEEFQIRLLMQKFSQISTFMNVLPIATMRIITVELIDNIYLTDIDNVFTAIYRLVNLEEINVESELDQYAVDNYPTTYSWPSTTYQIKPPHQNIQFTQLTKLKKVRYIIYDAKIGTAYDVSYCQTMINQIMKTNKQQIQELYFLCYKKSGQSWADVQSTSFIEYDKGQSSKIERYLVTQQSDNTFDKTCTIAGDSGGCLWCGQYNECLLCPEAYIQKSSDNKKCEPVVCDYTEQDPVYYCNQCKDSTKKRPSCNQCIDKHYNQVANQPCYYQCSYKCKDNCMPITGQCVQCADNSNRNYTNNCECNLGFFEVVSEPNTKICGSCSDRSVYCLECDETECTLCEIDYEPNPNDKTICIPISCPNSLQNRFDMCDSCIEIGTRVHPSCICQDYKYSLTEDGSCDLDCSYKCGGTTCQNGDGECDICDNDKRDILDSCNCIYGYYEESNNSTKQCGDCNARDTYCISCTHAGCDECFYNLITDNMGVCQCEISSLNSPLSVVDVKEFCDSCQTAAVDINMSLDYSSIDLLFYNDIKIIDFEGATNTLSNKLCQQIFKTPVDQYFGITPTCRLDSSTNKTIIIELGYGAKIKVNDLVEIKPNTIQFKSGDCNGQPLQSLYSNQMKLDTGSSDQSEIQLVSPQHSITLCEYIHVTIFKTFGDGQRGHQNFDWQLRRTNASDTEQLNGILQETNLEKKDNLKIAPLVLQEYSEYEFQVNFENFAELTNSERFIITTRSTTGASVSISAEQQYKFKTYYENEIIMDVEYLDCSSFDIQEVEKELGIEWYDISNTSPVSVLNTTQSSLNKSAIFPIEPYTQYPGMYEIQIKVYPLDDPVQYSITSISYEVEDVPLQALILGGNRMNGYASPLKIEAQAKDLNVQPKFQQDNLLYQWSCLNLVEDSACAYVDGTLVSFNNTLLEQNYKEKQLLPYNNYQFQIQVDKVPKQSIALAIIIIVELDLPLLTVKLPESVQSSKVNQNDDIQVEIDYEGNPDDLSYTLILLYDYDIVATKSYFYNTFQFKIWDLFSDFSPENSNFVLRVSLYDPNYFMPSQITFNLDINLPPIGGKIILQQNTLISLQDIVQIKVQNEFDEDTPLTYRLALFLIQKSYELQQKNGENSVDQQQNYLTDFQKEAEFKLYLPRCSTNQQLKNECVLMVSIQDSLGAIQNITSFIEVSPPSNITLDIQMDNIDSIVQSLQNKPNKEQLQILNILSLELFQINPELEYCINDGECNNNGSCLQNSSICECKQGFHLNDCSLTDINSYNKFLQTKKTVLDKLQTFIADENLIQSKIIKDQVLKSINLLQIDKDLAKLQSEEDLGESIQNLGQLILQQKDLISKGQQELIEKNNKGKISKKIQQATQTISKSLIGIDNAFQSISEQNQQINDNREKLYEMISNVEESFQQRMLPNSDEISFFGEDLFTIFGKNTIKKVQNKYFGNPVQQQQNYFYRENNENDTQYKNTTIFKNQTEGEVYETSAKSFNENPFQGDENYPYKEQIRTLQDIQIYRKIDNQQSQNNSLSNQIQMVELNEPIQLMFGEVQDDETEENIQNEVCLQKEKDNWQNVQCELVTKVINGKNLNTCKCKKLNPTTIIKDTKNLFKNSLASKQFSSKGIKALQKFEYHKSYMVYLYVIQFIIHILCIKEAKKLDQKSIKENQICDQKISNQIGDEQKIEQYQFSEENQMDIIIPQSGDKNNIDQADVNQDNMKQNIFDSNNVNINKSSNHIQNIKEEEYLNPEILSQSNIKNSNDDDQNDQIEEEEEEYEDKNQNDQELQKQNYDNKNIDEYQQKQYNQNSNSNTEIQEQEDKNSVEYQQQKNNIGQPSVQINNLFLSENTKKTHRQRKKSRKVFSQIFLNNNYNEDEDLKSNTSRNQIPDTNTEQFNEKNVNQITPIQDNCEQQQQKNTQQSLSSSRTLQTQNSQRSISQQSELQDKSQISESKEHQQYQLNNRSIWEGILIPHKFFGIFLTEEENLSRLTRFNLYYLWIQCLLAVSSMFTQQMDRMQAILFSVISATMVSLPILILGLLLKNKNKIVKFIGLFLFMVLYLACLYTIITASALMGVEKSNEWTIQYFSSFMIDTLAIQFVKNLIVIHLIKNCIMVGKYTFLKKVLKNKDIELFFSS